MPRVTGNAQDDIPIRDYDTRGAGALPPETRSSVNQSLFILGTSNDDPLSWLRAGKALERLWLEAGRKGYAFSLFTQVIELPYFRERLRTELGLTMRPHILLRIGKAPATSSSMRRRLQDVLTDNTATAGLNRARRSSTGWTSDTSAPWPPVQTGSGSTKSLFQSEAES